MITIESRTLLHTRNCVHRVVSTGRQRSASAVLKMERCDLPQPGAVHRTLGTTDARLSHVLHFGCTTRSTFEGASSMPHVD
jgi:hypothetical protein